MAVSLATALAVATLAYLAVSQPDKAHAAPSTPLLTADPVPTWQTNGIVWALEEVNGVVYVGGNFTAVRPPGAPKGQREVARKNLAAFDAATGALLPLSHTFTSPTFTYSGSPDWSCNVNKAARTFTCDTIYQLKKSPDGSQIYASGDFTWVDGKDRRKMAAFSTANAKTANPALTGFRVYGTNGRVKALAVSATTVYAGGEFTATGSPAVSRTRLAAFNRTTGATLPWAPTATADGAPANSGSKSFRFTPVLSMVLSPDKTRVIVAGNFFSINGTQVHGVAGLDAATGARSPWAPSFNLPATSFAPYLTVDEDTVYAAADGYGTFDGRWAINPTTGQTKWVDWCRGASSGLAVMGDVLYSGSHAHNCRVDAIMEGGFGEMYPHRIFRLMATSTKDAAPVIQHWFPSTNGGDPAIPSNESPSKQGTRVMLTAGNTVWLGGQFTLVNGLPQQGLTRFTRTAKSFKPIRPDTPKLASTAPGTVHVAWRGAEDFDDETLAYEVFRGNTLVHRVTKAGKPWDEPSFGWTDTGLAPGSSVSYQVRAVDSRGTASTKSFIATTTVAATAQPYSNAVLNDNPSDYWRMDEAAGPTLNSLGGPAATAGPGLAYGGGSAVATQSTGRSIYFNGTNSGQAYGQRVEYSPKEVTVEMFFLTRGSGKLIGFGQQKGLQNSGAYDRHLYVNAYGQLTFGVVATGVGLGTVTSPRAYNDGAWHHVAATFGPAGMWLYVDGVAVAARGDAKTADAFYAGVWRLGGDQVAGWPLAGASNPVAFMDEVAIYPRQLAPADIARHYNAARTG